MPWIHQLKYYRLIQYLYIKQQIWGSGITEDTFLYTVTSNFLKKSEHAIFQVVYELAEREHVYRIKVCSLCMLWEIEWPHNVETSTFFYSYLFLGHRLGTSLGCVGLLSI